MKGLAKMVWDFAEALKKHGNDGFKNVSVSKYAERIGMCTKCPNFSERQTCNLCGCYMPVKARWRTSVCPDNPPRWVNVKTNGGEEKADTATSD
jgi:hypothetical protein